MGKIYTLQYRGQFWKKYVFLLIYKLVTNLSLNWHMCWLTVNLISGLATGSLSNLRKLAVNVFEQKLCCSVGTRDKIVVISEFRKLNKIWWLINKLRWDFFAWEDCMSESHELLRVWRDKLKDWWAPPSSTFHTQACSHNS
jgi:hypothetical protein